ncbi:MAG: hypothetical protein AVDCRST_MAG87-1363 [uncultured Thermomicrobiales bacterium]|uniref:DUF4367 domain-containing protein n=1 Tax=uncultured Thermomicrobiales bacterium TaxID=1645740 RepID=A0A6J4UU42_9BACT|nr:MAG: hypothetical protein AVDCRST_MAG87-1363 [uncultured Thermomicrobiales bacterium]
MARNTRLFILIVVLGMAGMMSRAAASWAQTDATPPASPAASLQASPAASPVASPQASPVAGGTLPLPAKAQVPPDLVMTEDRERSLDEVTVNFADPAAARQQFVEWGWQRNQIRAFHTPEDAPVQPERIDGIYVSVHEFGTPEFAAEALDYSFDVQSADGALAEIPIDPLGETTRALYGTLSYGNEVTIYVQRDNLLIRLSASSPTGDPRAQATDLMETMLGG